MDLVEINLGEDGLGYVVSLLTGERGLSSKIARVLEQGGDVFAPLPAGTTRERALEFETGGLTTRRETYAWFTRRLEQLTGGKPTGSLVFQDIWMQKRDALEYPQNFAKAGSALFFDQSSIYYVLGFEEINAATISAAVRGIKSFKFVAVFSNFQFRAADIPATRVVADTLVDELARGAQEVFVTAYDQEGIVVWQRAN